MWQPEYSSVPAISQYRNLEPVGIEKCKVYPVSAETVMSEMHNTYLSYDVVEIMKTGNITKIVIISFEMKLESSFVRLSR